MILDNTNKIWLNLIWEKKGHLDHSNKVIHECMSAADGWVGACVDLVNHSYFCPSAILLSHLLLTFSVHVDVDGLWQFIQLCLGCGAKFINEVNPDLEWDFDTNQLCFLPFLSVLFHQEIADRLHKVLE